MNKHKYAFPIIDSKSVNSEYQCNDAGMTLRDYFAGQWLMGRAATRVRLPLLVDEPTIAREFAKEAYQIADAMMEERDSA